jgi:cold shock protein
MTFTRGQNGMIGNEAIAFPKLILHGMHTFGAGVPRFVHPPKNATRASARLGARHVTYLLLRKTSLTMTNGTVKFYNDQKGFGFIQPETGGADVFVHATALERAGLRGLKEGDKVSFDTAEDRRSGKMAVNNIQMR